MRRVYQGIGMVILFLGLYEMSWGQITTGTISGTVKDTSGAVLPGAKVQIQNVDTGSIRTVNTDSRGYYSAPNLSLGSYEVTTSVSGFQTEVRRGITLTVGQNAVIDSTLQVGAVTEKVEVREEAPLVETTNANVTGLVGEQQVRDLPLNARSLLELATLQAGVSLMEGGGTATHRGFATKLTIAGNRWNSNLFQVDGVETSDFSQTAASATGGMMGAETIREFTVITNGYSAEFGKHTGGVFNAVTKSGTNTVHGSAFEFLRNDKLDAPNFFDKVKPAFKRNQFGGSLGGPIVKDRSFYFGSYEGLRQRLGQTEFFLVPSPDVRQGRLPGAVTAVSIAPAVKPWLDAYPLPNRNIYSDGTADWLAVRTYPASENYYTVRLDQKLSDQDSLFGRYTFDDSNVNPSSTLNSYDVNKSHAHYVALGETRIFSPTVINQFLFGFNRTITTGEHGLVAGITAPTDNFTGRKNEFNGMFPHILGVLSITGGPSSWGGTTTSPQYYLWHSWQFKDDLFYTRGSHSLKFGFETQRMRLDYFHTLSYGGNYSFASMSDFLQGIVSTFQAITPASKNDVYGHQQLYGFYAQDDYRLTPRLTLNLGLRYEFVTVPFIKDGMVSNLRDHKKPGVTLGDLVIGNPAYQNPSLKNFAPRVGLAWNPTGSGKTSIRAGAGIYHDEIRLGTATIGSLGISPPFYQTGNIQGRGLASFPDAFFTQAQLLAAAPNMDGFDYYLQQPTVYKYSLDIQREFLANTSVDVGFSGTRGLHLMRVLNMNSRVGQVRDGRNFIPTTAPFRNPAFGRNRVRWDDARSDYYALRLSLIRRFSRGLQYQGSYTFSKTTDDVSAFSQAADFTNEPGSTIFLDLKDRGLAAFDIRHNFSGNFSYDLPGRGLTGVAGKLLGGWQTSAIVSLQTGTPFTATSGVNPAHFTNIGDRPDVAPGNKGFTYDTRNADRYFDPSAFVVPFRDSTGAMVGNAGRNILIGPGLAKVDVVFTKETTLRERLHLEFRSELFNLFNRANFGFPNGAVFANAAGAYRSTVGRITNTRTTSRQVQFGMRLVF